MRLFLLNPVTAIEKQLQMNAEGISYFLLICNVTGKTAKPHDKIKKP